MKPVRSFEGFREALGYGRRPRPWRNPHVIAGVAIGITAAAAVLVLAVIAWVGVPRWLEARRWRDESTAWYRAAVTFTEPPGTLKHTENPADFRPDDRLVAARSPDLADVRYKTLGGHPLERVPERLRDGSYAWNPTATSLLFLHERTARRGERWLVAVQRPFLRVEPARDRATLEVRCQLIAAVDAGAAVVSERTESVDLSGRIGPAQLRLFAGQADPADASRFAIPFEAGGRTGWIDGELVSLETPARSLEPGATVTCAVRLWVRAGATTSSVGAGPAHWTGARPGVSAARD